MFQDNFSFLILGTQKNTGALVDPADTDTVINLLDKYPHINISHVLYTHKHHDHIGQPEYLKQGLEYINSKSPQQQQKQIEFISHQLCQDIIPTLTQTITNDIQQIQINGVNVTSYHTPCHTRDHVLYNFDCQDKDCENQISEQDYLMAQEQTAINTSNCIFTGDTLFVGGVGRFFEGNAEEMLKNMDLLQKMDGNMDVFCAHEYTLSNYEWASKVELDNNDLQSALKRAQELRKQDKMTIPTNIDHERKTNLFMRCREQNLQNVFGISDPEQVMTILREMKNTGAVLEDIQKNKPKL